MKTIFPRCIYIFEPDLFLVGQITFIYLEDKIKTLPSFRANKLGKIVNLYVHIMVIISQG